MSALRSVAAYAAALKALMPRGRAWPEAGGGVWAALLAGLAPEFRRADARLLKLLDEADPRTCGETLADWERVLGLPDPCTPAVTSFEERRAAVVAKLRSTGGASRAFFIDLAATLGYEIEIVERRSFVCGLSECGGPAECGGEAIHHCWVVKFLNRRVVWFRASGEVASECGLDPLATIDFADEVECLITRLKPAHTHVDFDYSEAA